MFGTGCVSVFSNRVIDRVTPCAGNKAVAITRLSRNLCCVDEMHLCCIEEHSNAPCVYGIPWISSLCQGFKVGLSHLGLTKYGRLKAITNFSAFSG